MITNINYYKQSPSMTGLSDDIVLKAYNYNRLTPTLIDV